MSSPNMSIGPIETQRFDIDRSLENPYVVTTTCTPPTDLLKSNDLLNDQFSLSCQSTEKGYECTAVVASEVGTFWNTKAVFTFKDQTTATMRTYDADDKPIVISESERDFLHIILAGMKCLGGSVASQEEKDALSQIVASLENHSPAIIHEYVRQPHYIEMKYSRTSDLPPAPRFPGDDVKSL